MIKISKKIELNCSRSSCRLLRKKIGLPMRKELPDDLKKTLRPLTKFGKSHQFLEIFETLPRDGNKLKLAETVFYLYNNNLMFINLFASELNALNNHEKALGLLNSLPRDKWDVASSNIAATSLNGLEKYQEAFKLLDSLPGESWSNQIYVTAVTSLNGLERYQETLDLLKSLPKELWDNRIRYNADIARNRLKAKTEII